MAILCQSRLFIPYETYRKESYLITLSQKNLVQLLYSNKATACHVKKNTIKFILVLTIFMLGVLKKLLHTIMIFDIPYLKYISTDGYSVFIIKYP